jgi:ABC-2 type transport system permease protein
MTSSAFFAALRFELRLLRRDPAVWCVLVVIAAIAALAFANGEARLRARAEAVSAEHAETSGKIEALRARLADIESGRAQGEPDAWSDPRSASIVDMKIAAVAAPAPSPLAVVATGQSDLRPPALRVTSESKDHFLFADEIANPAHLTSGSIDLAFVLAFVFPLSILALCFDLAAREREQGTLALTLASASDPARILLAKLAARAGLPIAAMLAATAAGVFLLRGAGTLGSQSFVLLLAAILAYGLLWALLAAVVDGFGRSSAFNALTLIGVWAAVTLLAPAAINTLADTLYPAPSRAEMALAAQAATTDANREQDAALARYAQEHPGQKAAEMTPGDRREQTLRRLAVLEAANARVEAVLQRHDARLAEQHALADRLSFLSPALLLYRATADLAGTGDRRQAEFAARIDAFHATWRAFFASRIRAGAPLTLADYGALPRYEDAHDDAVVAAEATPVLSLGLGVPVLLLGVLALRGLRRCKAS